jgi:hypothetical protein
MSFTTYTEDKVLDHILKGTSFTAPAVVYVALYTSATNAAGGGTECTGGGYTRKTMGFTTATSGATENNGDVEFPTATDAWGTLTHTAILDASSGGNMLMETALTASKTISTGDVFRFQSGEFDVTLD